MDRFRDIILVFGKTGMGKTRWTRAWLAGQHRALICDPMDEYDGQKFDDLGDLIEHVMQYTVWRCRTEFIDDVPMLAAVAIGAGRCVLVIDEAQRSLPGRQDLPASILDVIYRGRHPVVSLVIIAQRPSTVNIAARSQWTRIITFRQTEALDCRWIEGVSGESLDLSGLAVGQYYDIAPTGISRRILDRVNRRYETIEADETTPSREPERGHES